jgi:hypothetical protein
MANNQHDTRRIPDTSGPAVKGDQAGSNTVKDPADWTTGNEPMTGAQASYLKTLSEEAHEEFDGTLSKADASRRIDELQEKTGRGQQSALGAPSNKTESRRM